MIQTEEVLRRLDALRAHVDRELGTLIQEIRGSAKKRATEDPCPEAPRPFTGRPLEARKPGRCAVCGTSIEVGASIIWNGDCKRAAHLGCGQPDPRELRR